MLLCAGEKSKSVLSADAAGTLLVFLLKFYISASISTNLYIGIFKMCPPSKNGHKKASKNEMNRSISLIY